MKLITRIRWEYGQAQPGMSPSARPVITGRTDSHDTAVVDLPLSIVEVPTLGEWV